MTPQEIVDEDNIHCGDCPFLTPYDHPFYFHTAWCWKQMRSLNWHDWWLADCLDDEPDEQLLKLQRSGRNVPDALLTALENK